MHPFQGVYNGKKDRSGKSLALPRLTLDYHEFVQTNESKPVRQLIPDPGAHLPPHPVEAPLVGALVVALFRDAIRTT